MNGISFRVKQIENLPPPRGVLGWGASTIASPGVKIWPLIIVKLSPFAVAASISAAAAAERVEGINIATQKLHGRQLKPLRREQCTTITTTVKEEEMEMPAKSGTTRGGMVNSAMTMSKLPSFSDPGLEGVVHVMQ